MSSSSKRMKVLCPVEKDGKTYWKLMGVAFEGKAGTFNIHLDGLPVNGKLHVREWDDERDARPRPSGMPTTNTDLPF